MLIICNNEHIFLFVMVDLHCQSAHSVHTAAFILMIKRLIIILGFGPCVFFIVTRLVFCQRNKRKKQSNT